MVHIYLESVSNPSFILHNAKRKSLTDFAPFSEDDEPLDGTLDGPLDNEKVSSDANIIPVTSMDNNGLYMKAFLVVMIIVAIAYYIRVRSRQAAEKIAMEEKIYA